LSLDSRFRGNDGGIFKLPNPTPPLNLTLAAARDYNIYTRHLNWAWIPAFAGMTTAPTSYLPHSSSAMGCHLFIFYLLENEGAVNAINYF